jgi:predicted nuclease of predicted toxin-antitoxin system
MPKTIRFHLDENCDPRIAAGLRLHAVDVTTTQEVGLLHAPDEDQHTYAESRGRVIITQDTDFLRL